MKRVLVPMLACAIVACQEVQAPSADLSGMQQSRAAAVGPRFIVTLQSSASVEEVTRDHGLVPDFVYRKALHGFAGSMSEAAQSGLLRDGRVARVERDELVQVEATASWGLDRVDQRGLPLDDNYGSAQSGAGVTIYVVDTGIRYSHSDFGGRASFGYDALGGDGSDCHGHGTHVSGTAAGANYGVAKSARLVAVRVLDCTGSGYVSGIIAGIDWVAQNGVRPAVANMSLSANGSTSLDDAVRRLYQAGIASAVAAANYSADACRYSPARAPEAITVGATDRYDVRASFSNYGSCVDLFAPGVGIISAFSFGDTDIRSMSGTSMASPHVAGAAALYLQSNPAASAQQVRDELYARSTKGKVTSANSTNNHLLYTGTDAGTITPPPPPPPPPTSTTSIQLHATGSKTKGNMRVDLSWSGAATSLVDVFRNNAKVGTVANSGAYTDGLGKGSGSFSYRVCEAGTATCSADVTVSF